MPDLDISGYRVTECHISDLNIRPSQGCGDLSERCVSYSIVKTHSSLSQHRRCVILYPRHSFKTSRVEINNIMGTKHQPLAFVSVSDLIRDKIINTGDYHHPFVISTSFMTPEHEEQNVKDAEEEDHDDLDTIDECYEYTKNMTTTAKRGAPPNDPNKLLGDGTIKKLSPETIKSSVSPTATSQAEFSENCSLVMTQSPRDRGQRPTSKVRFTSDAMRVFILNL